MEQRISLVTLGVADLPRAPMFYESLGWGDAQRPDDEVCFFPAGGMVLGLWTALGGHGAPGVELAHNVRRPEEVAVVLAEAERAGAGSRGRRVMPSGAGRPAPSRTRTATSGRSRTTPAGRSPTTAPSASDPTGQQIDSALTAGAGVTARSGRHRRVSRPRGGPDRRSAP